VNSRPAIARSAVRFSEAFDDATNRTRRNATSADLDRLFGRAADAPAADFSSMTR
jgi:hypothetical protein